MAESTNEIGQVTRSIRSRSERVCSAFSLRHFPLSRPLLLPTPRRGMDVDPVAPTRISVLPSWTTLRGACVFSG